MRRAMTRAVSSVIRTAQIAVACCALLGGSERANAQMPPHYPGSICGTPQFWCWAPQPGYPGTICFCPSPNGWIQGILM
jgi:hypothetical protein